MKIERVVVGMDFSEPAIAATAWAAAAFGADAEIVLTHCIDIAEPPSFLQGRLLPHDELVETARAGALQRLEELRLRLAADRVRVDIRGGRPAAAILEAVAEAGADLVVVGEHGRRRGAWNLLGSTAERLVYASPVPVLLARDGGGPTVRRVLAAIDESSATGPVLAWAGFLAGRFQARLVAAHAVDATLVSRVGLVSTGRATERFEAELREEALAWVRGRIHDAGVPDELAAAAVLFGSPTHEIVAAAERHDADLIVMGSRGAGALGARVLGSVARGVLRGAACSVLVVPDRDGEAAT